jgi:hypothetical protein
MRNVFANLQQERQHVRSGVGHGTAVSKLKGGAK